MMEIKVIVEFPGIPEAINNLANALANQKLTTHNVVVSDMSNNEPAQTVPTPAAEPVAQETTPATQAQATVSPEPVAEIPQTSAVAESAPTPAIEPAAAPASAKKYTREEIATAGSALVTQGKMNELLALLQKYGVQSVAQLGEAQYGAFAADLKALGAAL